MLPILVAGLIYTVIFLADYVFYRLQPATYTFASWRTWYLLSFGQLLVLFLYREAFAPFYEHLFTELLFLSLLTLVLIWFTYTLTKQQGLVCFQASRTERCLTPLYTFVKGTEIVFQQLVYCAIALSLVTLLGTNYLTYLAFVLILLIIHSAVVLGARPAEAKILTLGIAAIAPPTLYIFLEIGYFFPAVYLHALMYVFYWLTFADFDDPNDHQVDNRG